MSEKAHRRSRRPLTLAAVAIGVAGAATVGAWAGGFARSAAQPAKAIHGGAPVWVAGANQTAKPTAAKPIAVKPNATKPQPAVKHSPKAKPAPTQHAVKKPTSSTQRKLSSAVAFDLCATAGNVTIGSTSVPIWGFALRGAEPTCATVSPQLPGPTLEVNAGDVVTLNVTNLVPGHTLSIEAPGVNFAPGSQQVTEAATVSVTFTAVEGTYLYSSAGDAGRQSTMGLYGALVVHSGTPGVEDGVAVDAQHALVLSEIDPAFNAAPDTFDLNKWHPSLWLINGQAYPNTAPVAATGGQTVLLRWLNAGIDNNTMSMLGLRQKLIREDGYALPAPYEVVSQTFPSGETADGLVTIPAGAGRYPLYNRNLNLGMTTFVQVP
jgi:FtsP/CotA-like multicopper oxidase with cupredoxin domain